MRPIQIILIVMLVGVGILYFGRLRSTLIDRIIVLLFAIIGIVMVVMPDLTNNIAQSVGVGRGADLISYLGLIALTFVVILLYAHMRDVESALTDLARSIAISGARRPQQLETQHPNRSVEDQ